MSACPTCAKLDPPLVHEARENCAMARRKAKWAPMSTASPQASTPVNITPRPVSTDVNIAPAVSTPVNRREAQRDWMRQHRAELKDGRTWIKVEVTAEQRVAAEALGDGDAARGLLVALAGGSRRAPPAP